VTALWKTKEDEAFHGTKCRNHCSRFRRVVHPEPMGAPPIRYFDVNVPNMLLRGSEDEDLNGGKGDHPSGSQ